MKRTILFAIGGILLGGIIHIAVVFMVPYYANRDAWAQMDTFGPDDEFHILPLTEAGARVAGQVDCNWWPEPAYEAVRGLLDRGGRPAPFR